MSRRRTAGEPQPTPPKATQENMPPGQGRHIECAYRGSYQRQQRASSPARSTMGQVYSFKERTAHGRANQVAAVSAPGGAGSGTYAKAPEANRTADDRTDNRGSHLAELDIGWPPAARNGIYFLRRQSSHGLVIHEFVITERQVIDVPFSKAYWTNSETVGQRDCRNALRMRCPGRPSSIGSPSLRCSAWIACRVLSPTMPSTAPMS